MPAASCKCRELSSTNVDLVIAGQYSQHLPTHIFKIVHEMHSTV